MSNNRLFVDIFETGGELEGEEVRSKSTMQDVIVCL
jgi:hypothetical protein